MLSPSEAEELADLLIRKHLNWPDAPGIADDFVASVVRTTVADTLLVAEGSLFLEDFRA